MPGFDLEIARLAERLLIKPRKIDYRTNVFASKVTPGVPGVKPVTIEMIDAETKELVETLEVRLLFPRPGIKPPNVEESGLARARKVDACMVATGRVPNTKKLGLESMGIETFRGFVQVDTARRSQPRGAESSARGQGHKRARFPTSPLTRHELLAPSFRWTRRCACLTSPTAILCPICGASATRMAR